LRLVEDSLQNPAALNLANADDLPASLFTLGTDEVHVWLAKLDDHQAERFRPLLTEDEIARADRFHFAKDRNHFVVARGWLRKLLARYLRSFPNELRFDYAEKGKPSLAADQANAINFNLAHSHGLAIFALSRGREIGVDLEFIRDDVEHQKIAERFFSRHEIDKLHALPIELRKQAFFTCWTRKEAYIKARGEGLSMPLDQFDVSLAPGEAAALLRNDKEPDEVRRWTMQSVAVPDGFVAALVAEGDNWRQKSFEVKQLK
jgi:4'-phosphopantetheinyl transferase